MSELDRFRIGQSDGISCVAQGASPDPGRMTIFDRQYAILCRDAAAPIGQLFAFRTADGWVEADRRRAAQAVCSAPVTVVLASLRAQRQECTLRESSARYRVYRVHKRGFWFVAEGLAGYDSALTLGLRSLSENKQLDEEISIPATAALEAAELARAQAEVTDPTDALAEAYRLNNVGSYAEAAEYFRVLLDRSDASLPEANVELLASRALQQSNLGQTAEAENILEHLNSVAISDPILRQLVQNVHVGHLLNGGRVDDARRRLQLEGSTSSGEPASSTLIDVMTAAELNSDSAFRTSGTETGPNWSAARSIILSSQRDQLEGSSLRLLGDVAAAERSLLRATTRLSALPADMQPAAARLRAQITTERALIAEMRQQPAGAEDLYREALRILNVAHPDSPAVLSAQARLASHWARTGQTEEALGAFRGIVDAFSTRQAAAPALPLALAPYFELLGQRLGNDRSATAEMFLASQIVVGPGIARTQAVLARELSAGGGEAAQLFRQSTNITRDSERIRSELNLLRERSGSDAPVSARILDLEGELARLQASQVATLARLADFPQFRAVTTRPLTLDELQDSLQSGEAYWKLVAVGQNLYGVVATPDRATSYRLAIGADQLQADVTALRRSIAVVENNQTIVYPFDAALAHSLFAALAGPAADQLLSVDHIIFEADGEMARLPISLLVTEPPRSLALVSDPFDFTSVSWLGRRASVSTSVSPRTFRDVRMSASSRASQEYIGFGENAPIDPEADHLRLASSRSARSCIWPTVAWNRPISAAELRLAASVIGSDRATLVTGPEFTDSRISERGDLADYRIVHFATHGLTAPPRSDCTSEPALMTSLDQEGASDGLLTFREIFELQLDADLIILSACDTATQATIAATEAAGLASGGDFPLDGLVRAFIGAGARSVAATHWAIPDDFAATERLLRYLFEQPAGTSISTALRRSQTFLMDDPQTSHPFYWAAFAIIGDGAQPLLRTP